MIAVILALAAIAHQDTSSLDRAVAAFTGRPMGVEGGARTSVDARLRLAQCPTVSLSWRTDAHDAVVVACAGPDWRIYVPVIAPPRQAIVPAAKPALAVRAEKVIKRGDPLVIEAGATGFSITREGVAMADAAAGERLMVRVEGAKAPVQAVAVATGRATLPGWSE